MEAFSLWLLNTPPSLDYPEAPRMPGKVRSLADMSPEERASVLASLGVR